MNINWRKTAIAAVMATCLAWSGYVLAHGPRDQPGGYQVPVGALVEAKRKTVTALIVGDSYVAGGGGVGRGATFIDRACGAMGWVCNIDAQGGTGYTANGHANYTTFSPYIDRLGGTARNFSADYVIVTGGRNDIGAKGEGKAVRRYLRALRGSYPDSRIIVVAPFWNNEPPPATLEQIRAATKSGAKMIHADWIDTAGWLAPNLMGPDKVHPTDAGHERLSERLVAWMRGNGIKPAAVR